MRRPTGRVAVELFVVALGAVLVALAFRAVLPPGLAANQSSDFHHFYEPAARSLLAGEGLTVGGAPLERFPPLFPLLLAAVFALAAATPLSEAAALATFELACFGAAAALVGALAARLWGRRGALLAVAAWITFPLLLWLTKQPNSELPFLVLLYGAVWLFWATVRAASPRSAVVSALACGLVAGLAGLTRSIGLPLGMVLAIGLWAIGRRVAAPAAASRRAVLALCLVLGSAAAIVPWTLWLEAETGRAWGTGAANALEDGLTFAVRSKGYREAMVAPAGAVRAMKELDATLGAGGEPAAGESTRGEPATVGGILAVAATQTGRDPLGMAQLVGFKAVRAFYGTDTGRFEGLVLALDLCWLLVLGWAARRSARRGGAAAAWMRLVVLVGGWFWLATLFALPLVRYLVPAIGLSFTLLPALLPAPIPPRAARAVR